MKLQYTLYRDREREGETERDRNREGERGYRGREVERER